MRVSEIRVKRIRVNQGLGVVQIPMYSKNFALFIAKNSLSKVHFTYLVLIPT